MTTPSKLITWYLVSIALAACASWSALGQSLTYDPATHGQLAGWVNANQGPGKVLILPSGRFTLDAPVFLNSGTLQGAHPDAPTRISLGPRGVIWMAQAPLPQDAVSRVSTTADGRLALVTHPPAPSVPASFDLTETGIGHPMHKVRKLSVTVELDCPTGNMPSAGLFDIGPVALRVYDDPDYGRAVWPHLRLGRSSADPNPRNVEPRLFWRKSTGTKALFVLQVDLDAGTGSVTANGDILPIPGIMPGDVFPACVNSRLTLGAMPEILGGGRRGEWSVSGPPPNLRITRFEVSSPGLAHRLDMDAPRGPRIWTSNGPTVAIQPVPHTAPTFTWTGNNPRIRNLAIEGHPNSNQSGIRIGQAMTGDSGIYDCSFTHLGAGVRKLPGAVSYTHRFERLKFTYVGWPIMGNGMTIWGRDWSAAYPRFGVALVPDSNLTLRGIDVASPSDCQYYFRVSGGNAGGNLALSDGMLNDEDGEVAAGAIFRHDGSDSGQASLAIDNIFFNVDRNPALSLGKAKHTARARIHWQPWGTAITEVGYNWLIEGSGLTTLPPVKPIVPAVVTP